jgi:hypothetical protein
MKVPILAELFAEGKQPEILFWVVAPEVLIKGHKRSPKPL